VAELEARLRIWYPELRVVAQDSLASFSDQSRLLYVYRDGHLAVPTIEAAPA
jgi:hypothetical protein